MLTKLVGGALVIGSGAYVGFGQSAALRRREKYLLNIKAFLNMLEVEIQFSSHRMKSLLLHIDQNVALGNLLAYIAQEMDSIGIGQAWEQGVRDKTPHLSKDDREIFSMLGAELGMTDRETQIKNIRHIEKLIQMQYIQAQEKRKNLSKLYESGGVLAGLVTVILLF